MTAKEVNLEEKKLIFKYELDLSGFENIELISSEEYKQLRTDLHQKQELSPQEQEYLEEYRFAKQNGSIDDAELTLIRMIAKQLGISEERAAEIERMV